MNANALAIAELAAMQLTPEEAVAMQRDLEAILAYVDLLARIPTQGIEPMSHPGSTTMALREDATAPSLPASEALANAPAQSGGMFEVPKIVERA